MVPFSHELMQYPLPVAERSHPFSQLSFDRRIADGPRQQSFPSTVQALCLEGDFPRAFELAPPPLLSWPKFQRLRDSDGVKTAPAYQERDTSDVFRTMRHARRLREGIQ